MEWLLCDMIKGESDVAAIVVEIFAKKRNNQNYFALYC